MSETFIIHLERATARRPHVDNLLAASPFPARIWPACDGAALDPDARARLVADAPIFKPAYPFPLSMGEIGCFESHRTVWRHMVERSLPFALILEDDVAIQAGAFEAAVALATEYVDQLGYIQLQVRDIGPEPVVTDRNGVRIVRPTVVPLRTSAQLLSLDAARKLLAASDRIDRPVDVFIQMFWEIGVRPHCVVPSGVFDLSGPTTIQNRRSLVQKLEAEIRRPLFRRRIRRLSKAHD